MGLGDLLREGVADLVGVSDEMDGLREANELGQMLARRVEDLNWGDLLRYNEGDTYFDPSRELAQTQTTRAYRYFFNDPVVKRAVMLRGLYTFGRGIAPPKYRNAPDRNDLEAKVGQAYIERMWKDTENRIGLLSPTSFLKRDIESNLQANVFLLLFPSDAQARLTDEEEAEPYEQDGTLKPATLKIADLPDREIVDIVPHPGNPSIPVLYKRQYRARRYDFESGPTLGEGAWVHGDLITVYYRDWRFPAPKEWGVDRQGNPCHPRSGRCVNVKPWGPPADQIGEGYVYHVVENQIGRMRFGVTDLQSYLKWAKGLNEYMSARMSTVQAIAQIALRAKVKGGPKNVSQVASSIQAMNKLAGAVEGSTTLDRLPTDSGRSKAAIESPGLDLQPMIQDTGAQNAAGDVQTMKGQVAAGSGVPLHHLGEPGTANLATATSMDGPLLRMIQWNQERWETVVRDLTGFMLTRAGLDARRLEVDMPPILERDVANVVAYLTQVAAAVDPNGAQKSLHRFILHEMLESMGKQNAQELVDQLLPEEDSTPFQQNVELAQAAGQGPGFDPEADAVSGADDKTTDMQRAAVGAKDAAATAERTENNGRHRGPNEPGGPMAAGRTARDRAARRGELAVEGDLRESDAILDAIADELPVELVEAYSAALALFDEPVTADK